VGKTVGIICSPFIHLIRLPLLDCLLRRDWNALYFAIRAGRFCRERATTRWIT